MRKKLLKLVLFFFICECTFFVYVYFSGARELEVTFLNIGQGDAILINTPQGHNILIDGGPSNELLAQIGTHLPLYDKHIDLVVLTHPDRDHYFGLIELLKRYTVDSVMLSGFHRNSSEYEYFIQTALAHEVTFVKPKSVHMGSDIILDLVYAGEHENLNETSLVFKLTRGTIDFLLTGDAGFPSEEKLLKKNIEAEVLKVGHHGSKHSTSEDFLKQVSPDYAVIQVGERNAYGHPSSEVLERLEFHGITTLRNDFSGDIVMKTNGSALFVEVDP